MGRITAWIPVALLGLVGVALLAPDAGGTTQKDSEIIIAELRQIQAQIAQLQTSHAQLKQTIDELKEKASAPQDSLRKTLADSQVALQQIQKDLSILSERVDETNGRMGNLRQEISALRQTQQPLVVADNLGSEAQSDEASETETLPEPAAMAGPSATDIYNQARVDYTQGRYSLAISGFQEVLTSEPRGELADNAQYWIGECYLNQRQNDLALEAFDVVIREYPDSNKRSDAYYKKAVTLESMDRRSEAMLMYELVIEQFPRTQVERLARRKLEELMRTTQPRS